MAARGGGGGGGGGKGGRIAAVYGSKNKTVAIVTLCCQMYQRRFPEQPVEYITWQPAGSFLRFVNVWNSLLILPSLHALSTH